MDSFNSTFDNDEFEEVPSPFRKTAARPKNNLRSSNNIFARPMGTTPSEAPTVFEEQAPAPAPTRRSVARAEQTDFLTPKRRAPSVPQVEYLDEEEEDEEIEEQEEVQEKRVVRAKPKTKVKPKVDLLPRIGWGIVALAMLRLVFMERGVIDYMSMDGKIRDHQEELTRVQHENEEIGTEINRIGLDKTYQRQLAKEHLGVIAADEFLILFAGESQETQNEDDRQL